MIHRNIIKKHKYTLHISGNQIINLIVILCEIKNKVDGDVKNMPA
jgi:hypothetical protein